VRLVELVVLRRDFVVVIPRDTDTRCAGGFDLRRCEISSTIRCGCSGMLLEECRFEARFVSLSVLMLVQSSDVVTLGGVDSFAHVRLGCGRHPCLLGSSAS